MSAFEYLCKHATRRERVAITCLVMESRSDKSGGDGVTIHSPIVTTVLSPPTPRVRQVVECLPLLLLSLSPSFTP